MPWRSDYFGFLLVKRVRQLKIVRRLKIYSTIGQYAGVDAVNVVDDSGFILLQLYLVISKLLTDNNSGKMARLG